MVLAEFQAHLEEKLIFLILEIKLLAFQHHWIPYTTVPLLCVRSWLQPLSPYFKWLKVQGTPFCKPSLPHTAASQPNLWGLVLPRLVFSGDSLLCPIPLFGPALDVAFLFLPFFLTGFGGVQSLLYSFGERLCANT